MNESVDQPNKPEWKENPTGQWKEQSYQGRFGERVIERKIPDGNDSDRHQILRTFGNGYRETWNPDETDYTEVFLADGNSFFEAVFKGPNKLGVELGEILEGDISTMTPYSPRESFVLSTYVFLTYTREGLASLRAQAERPPSTLTGYPDAEEFDLKKVKDMRQYQEFFQIDGFTNDGFRWQEIAKDSSLIDSKEKSIQKATSKYGEKIPIQDNSFLVTRDGNTITIRCSSIYRKPRWTATIPLSVPTDKVNGIFNDTESDFRVLKDLIPASLKTRQ